MRLLSLRGVIAAVAAVSVALVAVLTLSLTLTSSLKALRDIGQQHALALVDVALLETNQLMDRPQTAINVLQNLTKLHDWAWPSDNATVSDLIEQSMLSVSFTNGFRFSEFGAVFSDNTRITCNTRFDSRGRRIRPAPYFGCARQIVTPISSVGGDHSRQTGRIDLWVRSTWSLDLVPPEHPEAAAILQTAPPAMHYHTADWNNSLVLGTAGARASIYAGVYLGGFGDEVSTFMTFAGPLYRRSDPVGAQGVFGFVVAAMSFTDFSRFLRRAKSTPNTEAFAVDSLGYLMGSSMGRPFTTQTLVASASVPIATGCASTATTGGLTNISGVYHVCRTHASAYGHPALAAMIADRAFAYAADPCVQLFRVDGAVVYAATAPVELRFSGSGVQLLLAMPEEDIIGGVVASRNAAIGVTCGVFVVVAAVMFVLISLLLRPLRGVAEQMRRAANFEEEEDAAVSAMAEVAELQEAAGEMSEELARVRAYVPQSVLQEKALELAGDDAQDFETNNGLQASSSHDTVTDRSIRSTTSNASRGSRASRRSSNRRGPPPGHHTHQSRPGSDSGLHAHLALQPMRIVSAGVLVANGRGFMPHSSLTPELAEGISARLSCFVKDVAAAVTSHHGVLGAFHGDHVTATFNAVTPCPTPGRSAALAAAALQSTTTRAGAAFGASVGVAVGRCAVGNVGSDTVKSFSTVGSAFTQALALERLTRLYGPGCHTLMTHRACMDAALRVKFRFVDILTLPGTSRPVPIAALLSLVKLDAADHASHKDGEWLYVLESHGNTDPLSMHNAAFVALSDGDTRVVAAYLKATSEQGDAPSPTTLPTGELVDGVAPSHDEQIAAPTASVATHDDVIEDSFDALVSQAGVTPESTAEQHTCPVSRLGRFYDAVVARRPARSSTDSR